MRITSIKLENFKTFANTQTIQTDHPMICFVGENNTGKTTIFAAIDFLKNGLSKDRTIEDYKNKNKAQEDVSVEITIEGQLEEAIRNFSETKFLPYIDKHNNKETLRIKRSSKNSTILQNGKPIQLDEKKITIFNPVTSQFENPTGTDKVIGSLFETQFIWSDLQSGDVVDFGSTKILGKLFKEISESFKKSKEWLDFEVAHRAAFITSDNALSKQSSELMKNIEKSLSDFYGQAKVEMFFQTPDTSTFFKLGDVHVDDGVNTSITEKGSGMQRALALSIIKVYADYLSRHKEIDKASKPFFFFIDEPEISLHPKAQFILVQALKRISQQQQIFVTTHSPHFLKSMGTHGEAILITSKDNDCTIVTPAEAIATFPFSPTLAEINYFAYQLETPDFHNELYGFISKMTDNSSTTKLDNYLENKHKIEKNKQWIRIHNKEVKRAEAVTLPTYIRHSIHHPENKRNEYFTEDELKQSISEMLQIIKSPEFKQQVLNSNNSE